MFDLIETTSPQHFRSAAVDHIMKIIAAVFDDHGSCTVGLSGGRTPRPVYEEVGKRLHRPPLPHSGLPSAPRLGLEERASSRCRVDAEAGPRTANPPPEGEGIHFFLVDERYVPKDHPESNQRLVRETLLKHLSISEENLVSPNTALPIDDCIADYTRRLKELWKNRLPDLVILGMGTDGHTASLFPPLSDLALSDEHLILHTQAPKGVCCSESARDRITLSLNAIATAENFVLLLQGAEKKRTWEEMMVSPEGERRWPLKRIMEAGKLTVMLPPALPS